MMMHAPIEVAPRNEAWIVRIRDRELGVFPASSCAVTYARALAEKAAREGKRRPRILVQFSG